MGREIKRVVSGFDWPLGETWKGFINPFYEFSHSCEKCGGTGSSPEYQGLVDTWYGNAPFRPADRGSIPFTAEHPTIRALAERNVGHGFGYAHGTSGNAELLEEIERLCALFNSRWMHHLNDNEVAVLIKARRLMDFTHNWDVEKHEWLPKNPPYTPTAREVNDWSLAGIGHDSINCWHVVDDACQRFGYPSKCAVCNGEGSLFDTAEHKKQCDDWTKMEPPAGDAYQLWETVSEGSPISPAFDTPEALAQWLTDNKHAKWINFHRGMTYDGWLKFIKDEGWAPSLVTSPEGVQDGVQFVTEEK